jgi:hypothetical protein
MIIIASNWPQGQLDKPEVLGRLLDYLLIRLITVFDPAFCRVFFFRSFSLLQANEDVSFCDGADHSKDY